MASPPSFPSARRTRDSCCHEEAPIDYLTYVGGPLHDPVKRVSSQFGRDDRRSLETPSSAKGPVSARPLVAWRFVCVHLADRGWRAHPVGQSAPQARAEAKGVRRIPRDRT